MTETIIDRFEERFSEDDRKFGASNILRLNSEVKKLGVKKIKSRGVINDDLIEKELTLYIHPEYYNLNAIQKEIYKANFTELRDLIISKNGCPSLYDYYQLRKDTFDTQKSLKINFKDKKIEIGHYIEERNIIILVLPLPINYFRMGDDFEYFDLYLSWIKEIGRNYKFVEKNTDNLSRKLMIEKYLKIIKSNILDKKGIIQDKESEIKSYQEGLVKNYNTIKLYSLEIISLNKMKENLGDSLLEEIEEIKKLKFVRNVKLETDGISLEFEKIFIRVQKKDIEMGEYKIKLKPNKIEIINKQPITYGNSIYHSCHIKNGAICFGDEQTMIFELLGTLKLKKLVHFLYLYLKTYNPEDTYLSMDKWIEAKEKEKDKLKK